MIRGFLTASSGPAARFRRRSTAALCGMALFSASLAVRADDTDIALTAEALFVRARTLMKERRYDEACAAFENSERLDPASGTLLNLGVCRESQGRPASAYRAYSAGLALSRVERNSDGETLATKRLAAIEPTVPRVVVWVRAPRPGLVVRLDGAELDFSALSQPIPVDPGEHRIDSSGPDQAPWSTQFRVGGPGSQTIQIESPPLESDPAKPAASTSAVVPPVAPRASSTPVASPSSRPFPWAVALSGGVGAAGLLGTAYFGIRAMRQWDTRNEHCTASHCDATAARASERAADNARLADIAAGIAIVGAGAAVSLLLFDGGSDQRSATGPSVRVASHGADLELSCEF
jgi:hypothetical protein